MATITIAMSSFIILMTLFHTLSASMATVQLQSPDFPPPLVSSGQSTRYYSGLSLIRPQDASNGVAPVTDDSWDSLVLNSENLVFVQFWAEWCGPCRVQNAVVNGLSNDYAGRVEFYKLNIDDNQLTPAKYGIRSVPTVLIFKNGELRETLAGAHTKQSYINGIERNL